MKKEKTVVRYFNEKIYCEECKKEMKDGSKAWFWFPISHIYIFCSEKCKKDKVKRYTIKI